MAQTRDCKWISFVISQTTGLLMGAFTAIVLMEALAITSHRKLFWINHIQKICLSSDAAKRAIKDFLKMKNMLHA